MAVMRASPPRSRRAVRPRAHASAPRTSSAVRASDGSGCASGHARPPRPRPRVSTICEERQAGRPGTPRRRPRWPRCRPPGRRRRAAPPARARRTAGNALVVERLEGPGRRPCSSRSRAAAPGTRSGQPSASAIGSRMSGGRGLGERRAVGELDHRVDDRLRVDHDVDAVEREVEEQVRLDHLQPLVDQGRGVDRDDRAHVPGRVRERLLGRDVRRGRRGCGRGTGPPLAVRTSRRTSSARPAAQALGQRGVLGVDRDDLAWLRRAP